MKHCGLIRELQVFHGEPEPGHSELNATHSPSPPCQAVFPVLPSKRDHCDKPVFLRRASQCPNMPVHFGPILIALPLDQALKPIWRPSPGSYSTPFPRHCAGKPRRLEPPGDSTSCLQGLGIARVLVAL